MNNTVHWIEASNNVRLMYCPVCKISTNHHRVGDSELFVCWCGAVVEPESSDATLRGQLDPAMNGAE